MRLAVIVVSLLALLAGVSLAGPARPARVKIVNRNTPGERVSLAPELVSGGYTIVEFYSNHCPPCLEIGPLLAQLAQRRQGIYVRRVNIDRRGMNTIDWGSPVAKQYDIHRVPHFRIYGPDKKLEVEGNEARDQVIYWMQEINLVR